MSEDVKEDDEKEDNRITLKFMNAFFGLLFAAELVYSIILMVKNFDMHIDAKYDSYRMNYVFYDNIQLSPITYLGEGDETLFYVPNSGHISKNFLFTFITILYCACSFMGIISVLLQIYNPCVKKKNLNQGVDMCFMRCHFILVLILHIVITLFGLGFLVFFFRDYKDEFGHQFNIGYAVFSIALGVLLIVLVYDIGTYIGFITSVRIIFFIISVAQICWIGCGIFSLITILTKKNEKNVGFQSLILANVLPAALPLYDPMRKFDINTNSLIAPGVIFLLLFFALVVLGLMMSCGFKTSKTCQKVALVYAALSVLIVLSFVVGIVGNLYNAYFSNANVQKHPDEPFTCFVWENVTISNTTYFNYPPLEIYKYGWCCSIYFAVGYLIIVVLGVVTSVHISLLRKSAASPNPDPPPGGGTTLYDEGGVTTPDEDENMDYGYGDENGLEGGLGVRSGGGAEEGPWSWTGSEVEAEAETKAEEEEEKTGKMGLGLARRHSRGLSRVGESIRSLHRTKRNCM